MPSQSQTLEVVSEASHPVWEVDQSSPSEPWRRERRDWRSRSVEDRGEVVEVSVAMDVMICMARSYNIVGWIYLSNIIIHSIIYIQSLSHLKVLLA
jgi:hypothetical protein